jgi:hypothetical protein
MTDIFEAKILCKKCNVAMKPIVVNKEGVELRAIECTKCGDKIIHPADITCLNNFNTLKGKNFNVKLRIVGNSHAISIPKEIIEFINQREKEMHRRMNEMVKLCFEDFDRISLNFAGEDEEERE